MSCNRKKLIVIAITLITVGSHRRTLALTGDPVENHRHETCEQFLLTDESKPNALELEREPRTNEAAVQDPASTSSGPWTPSNTEQLAIKLADLYLYLHYGSTAEPTDPGQRSTNISIWEDRLAQAATISPGIADLVRQKISNRQSSYFEDLSQVEKANIATKEQQTQKYEKVQEEEAKKWNVCFRTQQIKVAIERRLRMRCENIKRDDLLNVQELDLTNEGIAAFKPNDFLGLYELRILALKGNKLKRLPADMFRDFPLLERLELGFNKLTALPKDLFKGLRHLSFLQLGSNKIRALHPNLFQGLSHLDYLDISYNPIARIPKQLFRDTKVLDRVYFCNLPIDQETKKFLKETLGLAGVNLEF